MVTDPVADFVNQLKTASKAGKECVCVPYSNLKHKVADVLAKEGFVKNPVKKGKKVKKFLEVELTSGKDVTFIKRVSKPSRRIYKDVTGLRTYGSRLGTTVVSTPKGIMTTDSAVRENVGGEIMFTIN